MSSRSKGSYELLSQCIRHLLDMPCFPRTSLPEGIYLTRSVARNLYLNVEADYSLSAGNIATRWKVIPQEDGAYRLTGSANDATFGPEESSDSLVISLQYPGFWVAKPFRDVFTIGFQDRVLTLCDDNHVALRECNGHPTQQWAFELFGNHKADVALLRSPVNEGRHDVHSHIVGGFCTIRNRKTGCEMIVWNEFETLTAAVSVTPLETLSLRPLCARRFKIERAPEGGCYIVSTFALAARDTFAGAIFLGGLGTAPIITSSHNVCRLIPVQESSKYYFISIDLSSSPPRVIEDKNYISSVDGALFIENMVVTNRRQHWRFTPVA